MPDQTVTAKFVADISDFQSNLRALQGSARELKASAAEMSSSLSQSGSGMQSMSQQAMQAVSSTRAMGQSARESKQGFLEMVGGIANTAEEIGEVVQMAGQFVAAIAKQVDATRQAERGFNMLGMSIAEARKQLQAISSMSVSKAFGAGNVTDIVQLAGRLGKDIEKTKIEVQQLGDALAAAGGKAENLKPIWEKMQEIQQKTRVTKQDIDDLARMGIASWQLLSDASGKSINQLQKEAERGALSGKKVYQDLLEGATQFSKGASMAAQDFGAQWERVVTNSTQLLGPFISELADLLEAINKMIEALRQAEPLMTALKQGLTGVGLNVMGPLGNFMPLFGMGGHASGITDNPEAHWSIVGEEGPEYMYVPERASIFPNGMSPFEQRSSSSGSMLPALSSLSAITPLQGHSGPIILQINLDSKMIARQTFPHLSALIREFKGVRK